MDLPPPQRESAGVKNQKILELGADNMKSVVLRFSGASPSFQIQRQTVELDWICCNDSPELKKKTMAHFLFSLCIIFQAVSLAVDHRGASRTPNSLSVHTTITQSTCHGGLRPRSYLVSMRHWDIQTRLIRFLCKHRKGLYLLTSEG